MAIAAWICLCAAFFLACSNHCRDIDNIRERLGEMKATDKPHVIISVPFAVAEPLLDKQVGKIAMPSLSRGGPAAGPIALAMKSIRTTPGKVRLVARKDDRIGLSLPIHVQAGSVPIATVETMIALRPAVSESTVVVAVSGADIQAAEVSVKTLPVGQIARGLQAQLPPMMQPLVPARDLEQAAAAITKTINSEATRILREQVISKLGPLARVVVHLPPMPLRDVSLGTLSAPVPALVIRARTTLPIASPATEVAPSSPRTVQVGMSGAAAVALGNWAMDQGKVPARYNRDMQPDKSGAFSPRLAWVADAPRPLKMHVFATEPTCMHLLVGARVSLAKRGDRVEVAASDGTVEQVDGSWPVKTAVWLDRMGKAPMAFLVEQSAIVGVEVAGDKVSVRLEEARIEPSGFLFQLAIQ